MEVARRILGRFTVGLVAWSALYGGLAAVQVGADYAFDSCVPTCASVDQDPSVWPNKSNLDLPFAR